MNDKLCYYEGCNEVAVVKGLCLNHYNLWLGNISTAHKSHGWSLEKRFWRYVWRPTKDGCWIWKGLKHSSGYGIFFIDRKRFCAHRISWQFRYGDIPKDICILHKCDNPPCVNPKHLWLGTKADNSIDMIKKGRCTAKLTENDVLEIRRLVKLPFLMYKTIAEMFCVDSTLIPLIKNYKIWKYPEILQMEKEQNE